MCPNNQDDCSLGHKPLRWPIHVMEDLSAFFISGPFKMTTGPNQAYNFYSNFFGSQNAAPIWFPHSSIRSLRSLSPRSNSISTLVGGEIPKLDNNPSSILNLDSDWRGVRAADWRKAGVSLFQSLKSKVLFIFSGPISILDPRLMISAK